ncbi:hypothetical protein TRFO_13716 [Tritrichomonas foetus]|uniref:Uncharacterized protein n=1 Tax=Tritrichomonas foetus TaxID=1144522 RepID=A0A1J4KXB3_9EUKA|nr:hypothetical protein TRFO_13716 [Tritrichomonas foetus]|eukprot:OHT15879.1 hypothetical protein TRFO_13716 [Tritrichomonas foetus]
MEFTDSFDFESQDNLPEVHNQNAEEIARLKQKIIKLEEENKSARIQFEEAIKVTNEMDSLFNKNKDLAKQNRELQADVDEMKRRLELSFRINDELQGKLEQEKITTKSRISKETQNNQQQLKEIQQSYENKIQGFKNEIEQLNKQNKQIKEENSKNQSEISSLLNTAEGKFHSIFDTLYSLNKYIKNLEIPQQSLYKSPNDLSFRESAISQSNINDQLSSLKSKYRKLKNIRGSLEKENDSLHQELETQKGKYEGEIKSITNEINDIKRQQKIKDLQNSQENDQLKAANERLLKKIEKLEEKTAEAQQQSAELLSQQNALNESINENNRLQDIVNDLSNSLKKSKKTNEKLKKQVTALMDQIGEANSINAALEKKINADKEKNKKNVNSLRNSINELENENRNLTEKINKLEAQNESNFQAISHYKSNINALQGKLASANNSISSFETLLSKQSNEISSLSHTKDNQTCLIQKQISLLSACESEIKKLTAQVNAYEKRIENEKFIKREHQISDILPESCWICMDLPKDLCDAIAEIGRITIQPADQRLRQALSIVAVYLQENYIKMKNNEAEQNKKFGNICDLLKQLLNLINIHIGEPSIEFELLIKNPNLINDLSLRFAAFRDELETIAQRNDKDGISLKHILDVIGTSDLQKAENEIDKMRNLTELRLNEIKHLQLKNKHLKSLLHKFADDLDARSKEIKAVAAKGQKEVDDIQNQLNNKFEECETLKAKVLQLQNEIAIMEDQHREEIESSKNEQLDMTNILCQRIKNDCEQRLKLKDQEIFKAQKMAEKSQHSLNKSKARNAQLHYQMSEKDEQIERLLNEIEQTKKEQKDQYAVQVKNVREQCNEAIDSIRKESQEKDNEILRSKKLLKDVQAKFEALNDTNNKLQNEKHQLCNHLEASKQELERERRLTATKLKAITLSSEMKAQNETESIKINFEQQRREIFHFAAETFSQFFDPRVQITESSFKTILQNVRSRLDSSIRQEEAIKRVLGLVGNENIESVLNQIMSSSDQQKNIFASYSHQSIL